MPEVDASSWRLRVEGHVGRPLELSLPEIQALPSWTVTVTLECAGNGRALLSPRPLSQPWLHEAVGTAQWTGVRLSTLVGRARPPPNPVAVGLRGLDPGLSG